MTIFAGTVSGENPWYIPDRFVIMKDSTTSEKKSIPTVRFYYEALCTWGSIRFLREASPRLLGEGGAVTFA
jgi:hypothetical protein